ncbi:heterokaryon incompatibility protein-domain-containing protein [Schizothecium vesticola]|uniref:Heterokaryon incompatibility protein-domain-containing protein n=1 Tax=Schizothecium vesticola TaxID=314040 RepID=A0AA40F3C5_9PEZI|nr:heterokaryon incompatibility protein-domain-containing protein [Schizothecium vesticola]
MWPFNPLRLGPVGRGFYQDHTLALGPSDIRVLRLHHGSSQDSDIICTLERRYLPQLPPSSNPKADLDCTALSYTWGDATSNLRKIRCNGTDFIVTQNLHSALYHLRDHLADTILWIDAICIDQNNNNEKGTQVGRMGEIYSRARHTVIWLGDTDLLSRAGLRACWAFAARSRADASTPESSLPSGAPWWDPWKILPPFLVLLLLRRLYFSRIWVVQEAALGKNLQVACGVERISWTDFSLGATIILEAGFGSRSSAGVGNILVARSLLPWTAVSGFSDPANIFRTLTQHKVPQIRNILSLAILFRRCHATEPVDKLYGLLGLCEHIKAGSTYGIPAAYSQNDPSHKNRIYISSARRIMEAQGSLMLFSAVNRRPQSLVWGPFAGSLAQGRQAPALPTWVPDWSDSGSAATPLSLMLAQTQNTDLAYTHRDLSDPYKASPEDYSPHLSLSGHRLDGISVLGDVCNTEKAQSSAWFSIRYTFTMAENHRLEILSKWHKQFRPLTQDAASFWRHFISTITCGSRTEYDEAAVRHLLRRFSTRSPRRLPTVPRTVAACLGILPPAICVVTREGFLQRILMYWCAPVVAVSCMWYMCFQLVPNFMFQEGWSEYGVNAGFLKADFDGMELRRLAMLDSGCLVLVPQAANIGDQVWSCRGATVPLLLRPSGSDFEMVGECYSATLSADERKDSADVAIRLV